MRSVLRLASRVTSARLPAGRRAGWLPDNGVQHHGQLPLLPLRLGTGGTRGTLTLVFIPLVSPRVSI